MTEARKDRRAPASLKVKYKTESVDGFVDQLAGDVSRSGIFIKTKKPLDPGALLKFEFQLQNGEPVIFGVGRVAWRRMEQAAQPTLPAGMGIKFIKLNGQSRSVIEQIEAKHGPGSRYDQTEGAEIATSISSLPPEPSSAVSRVSQISASPGAAEPAPSASERPESDAPAARTASSSPPLRAARVSGLKATSALNPSFRPPPAAAGSVPPSRASARPAPRGALGAASAPRRASAAQSTARDASEFLATAFSVGGAGREVRSEADAQAQRARQDPHSVDLANELFGDLGEPAAKAAADASLERDPTLGQLRLSTEGIDDVPNPDALATDPGDESVHAADTKRPPADFATKALNNQLSLSLGQGTSEGRVRPGASAAGRLLWAGLLVVVCVAVGGAVFFWLRAKAPAAGAAAAGMESGDPGAAPDEVGAEVSWAVSSEPTGAQVSVDGQPAGTTPVTLQLREGKTVQLRLQSPGHLAKVESLTVTQSMPARTFMLEPLPYELVVSEPEGAKVTVGDKSVEAPEPLVLGVLEPDVSSVSVTIDKPGYRRTTRKLARSDFHEQEQARRAELRVSLAPLRAERRAERKAAAPRPAPSPAELQAAPPPEPPEPVGLSGKPVVEVKSAGAAAETAQPAQELQPAEPALGASPPPEPPSIPVPPSTAAAETREMPAALGAPPPAPEPEPGDKL